MTATQERCFQPRPGLKREENGLSFPIDEHEGEYLVIDAQPCGGMAGICFIFPSHLNPDTEPDFCEVSANRYEHEDLIVYLLDCLARTGLSERFRDRVAEVLATD